MPRTPQKRTLQTRETLITTARQLVSDKGYEGLRIEEVVKNAGVAKGTFFSHFKDKEALMDLLIGSEIDVHLDKIEQLPAPQNVEAMVNTLMPMLQFMTSERYVFDIVLRYSGAASEENIGPIAMTFCRQLTVLSGWLAEAPFRKDISSDLIAEGIQAFAIQAMALSFCAINQSTELRERLQTYLTAWLLP